MTAFKLPDLGEGLDEAEIVAWHVNEGDHVTADQPLVSVETAKAVVEIPSPQAGRIKRRFGRPGDRIRVGAPLVEFKGGESVDAGAIVGVIETAKRPHAPAASPAVRARARELGVDLATVRGTGPEGAITRRDVDVGASPAAGSECLRGVRRAMAEAMAKAGASVVPATLTDEADVSHWTAATDATVLLIKAMAAGAAVEPALNAHYDGVRQARRLHSTVDLGLAIDAPDGLFVPVLRDVAAVDAAELRRRIDDFEQRVKARSVALAELRGATITLSNFGTIGGRHAVLVVLPPQVAIVGAGRAAPMAVIREGAIVSRIVLPLSLTFDHRAVTGAEAACFMRAMIAALENAGG
jgi:pyruvate dehydrogenase E2 component (dihydrolipoamide acetyltransferase)